MPNNRSDKELDSLKLILNEIGAYIYTKDINGCYTYANKSVLDLFGVTYSQVIGKDDSHFFDLSISKELNKNDNQVLKDGITIEREELNAVKSTGDVNYYRTVKKPLFNELGEISGMCVISTDITEVHNLKEELKRQAATDSLTGLYNRGYYFEHAKREFAMSKRSHLDLSIIMMDIDFFKYINDNYGHTVGDRILCDVGKICLDTIRNYDVFSRISGDEFAILLPNTDIGDARLLAERIRTEQEKYVHAVYWDDEFKLTMSFGVTNIKSSDTSFDDMFSRVDRVLYEAKEKGRNQVCYD